MADALEQVVGTLADTQFKGPVFNPWADVDRLNGTGQTGPDIRRQQLGSFFRARRERAKWVLVGEAMGYQGGHFSGVPMTSERILLGHMRGAGIAPADVLPDLQPRRTSRPSLKPTGFTEPTATIVWGAMRDVGMDPFRVVLWNTFAWHPYRSARGLLSNRRPKKGELERGMPALRSVLGLFPGARVAAVGRIAAACLREDGFDVVEMRHPAHGGAPLFREQLASLAAG
jgi:hypothetical protein